MLKRLSIHHVILIEEAHILFDAGMNVLSGETGSGKSAIMEALALIAGERTDTGVIRKGHEKAVVEALFDLSAGSPIYSMLEEAGIEYEAGEELIIKREIQAGGKSRAFVNNQAVQLLLLRKIGEHLLRFVGQHASQLFQNLDNHRSLLDNFAGAAPLAKDFAKEWSQFKQQQERLDTLKTTAAQRARDIASCRQELEEIAAANLQEGEEEELFAEYSRMNDSEEIAERIQNALQLVEGEDASLQSLFYALKQPLEKLVQLDPKFQEIQQLIKEAAASSQEAAYALAQYLGKLESNPQRLAELNDRLGTLNKLKKCHGATLNDIFAKQKELSSRLEQLEGQETEIEMLAEALLVIERRCNELAARLTEKRSMAAGHLSQEIVRQLRVLNMPKVELEIQLAPQKRTMQGDERVEFYLRPNVGEHLMPIRECASGGELSRLMLSVQAVMAGKEEIPILVFDEVDANIGGETAAVVGDKLAEISQAHQVLCVTHFPQVAAKAAHHLQISKQESGGRTYSLIRQLQAHERQTELERMLGL